MKNVFMSKNGIEVRLHPESHPHRTDLLEEAIAKITLPSGQTFYRTTVDLGRVVGVDHLVSTDENSKVIYITRGNRNGQTPMVINQDAKETSKVTIVLCVATDPEEFAGKWVVVTLFEGDPGMPEPWDRKCEGNPELKAACQKFWNEHALVPTEAEWPLVANELFNCVEERKRELGW